MPSTNAQTHNCRAGPSTRSQSTSLGKKRKYQLLSDVFDDSNIGDTEDKGRKTTTKPTRKIKPKRAQKGVKDHYRSSKELCAHALTSTDSSKRSRSASPANKHRRLLPSSSFNDHDTQNKKVRKIMTPNKAPKDHPSQSSTESPHGILRNIAQIDSPEHPQSTCPVKPLKPRLLPDLFHGDLDKHAAQDKLVLEGLKRQEVPLDVVGHVPKYMLWPIILEVTSVARMDDPDVPLISSSVDISNAIHDEGFQKIGRDCYRSKSFKDVRNYSLIRCPKVHFSDSVVGED